MQRLRRKGVLALWILLPILHTAPIHAQQTVDLSSGEKSALFASTRGRYYNLRAAGLKGFGCEAEVDWTTLFNSINGSPLADTDAALKYLKSSRLRFTVDLSGKSEVYWDMSGTPPEGREKGLGQLQDGLKQMIGGFLTSWTPFLNGSIVTSPAGFAKTSSGYTVADKTGDTATVETFDVDLLLQHLSVHSDKIAVEADSVFTASPDGLLLTGLDSTSKQPPTAPAAHLIMTATFTTMEGFRIPETLLITMPNVLRFPMKFTGCTLQKQAP